MRIRSLLISMLCISVLVSCQLPATYTYYCKERDFSFKMIEEDTIDILVFGDRDSVFLPPAKGQYIGLQFHIPEKSDTIYFELTSGYPFIYKYVENKYTIKFLHFDYKYGNAEQRYLTMVADDEELHTYLDALDNHHSWGFYGGCDQGRYTFSVWNDSVYVGVLDPLR